MWQRIIEKPAKNDNGQEINLFDVKELYDAAYAEKAKERVDLRVFQKLLDQAERLDRAYRQQLALKMAQPFTYRQAA